MTLSKLMTIFGFLNAILLGWLLVARVVPADPTNLDVFQVFLGMTFLPGVAYAMSQAQPKSEPVIPEYRPTPVVETKGPAG